VGLDREKGEFLEGLGRGRVVPTAKWARFLDVAADLARKHFEEAGARRNIVFSPEQILAQEFVLHSKIVFTFCVPIAGLDHFYNYTLELSPQAVSELALTGQWPAVYADLPNMRAN